MRRRLRFQQHNLPAGEQKISLIFYIGVSFKSICSFFELTEPNNRQNQDLYHHIMEAESSVKTDTLWGKLHVENKKTLHAVNCYYVLYQKVVVIEDNGAPRAHPDAAT